jgi:chitinase
LLAVLITGILVIFTFCLPSLPDTKTMLQQLRYFLLGTFLISVAYSCKKSADDVPPPGNTIIAPPPPFGFYVVGYFPSYRTVASVPDVKFKMCNVINYAFATVNSSGTLAIPSSSHLLEVKTKAKANGAKIFLSVAGLAADFKTLAATAQGRTSFVTQAMNLVRTYGFDGLDIDWEFPRTDDGTDITFTQLMKQLSDSCHTASKYYLTAAITAGKYSGAIRDAIKSELWQGNYVDWFNIMAYDDFNTTVPYKHHCDYTLATVCLNYWLGTRGMPASKAVLGMAGYGRASGITQTGTTLSYDQILTQGGNPQSDSAIVSQGTFNNYTIYYNGLATVKKKAMLAKQIANGIMLWEKSQDNHGNNSLLKAVCDTIGRPY